MKQDAIAERKQRQEAPCLAVSSPRLDVPDEDALEALVLRLRRDRPTEERTLAWGRLVAFLQTYESARVIGRIRSRVKDTAEVLNVLHEFYLGFFDYPPPSRQDLRIEFRILDAIRTIRRHEGRSCSSFVSPAMEGEAADEACGPEGQSLLRETERELHDLLASLDHPRYVAIARMRYLEGSTLAEIAKSLGHPLGTIKSDLHREILPRLRRAHQRIGQGLLPTFERGVPHDSN